MVRALLLQLPIPRHTFGLKTGNIPLGAACLKLAARGIPGVEVDILPESLASYLGDAALLELLRRRQPDVVGFTVFSWNLERSLHMAGRLKEGGGPRIVFGGPEITPDNRLARSPAVDRRVFGEGETVFRRLLSGPAAWKGRGVRARAGADTFRAAESPYLCGLLEPELENIMLLETQRGCPYRCGFCFYNKSRPCLLFAEEQQVLRAVAWAVERRIGQVYLLDPSLNVRPGLKRLLTEIAGLNASRAVRFFSEIRAEGVDDDLADRFAAAGFDWFEIGLQTTNPRALRLMRRPTRLPQVLAGAQRLKARGITPSIDLILGLPGDDLAGFMRSVDWVAENDLQDDVQVFPLAVLPGTDFRRRRRELGLHAAPRPPYTVLRTGGFSPEDFLQAYDYAESRFDTVFFPLPDLDASWRLGDRARPWTEPGLRVRVGAAAYTAKLIVARGQALGAVRRAAGRLTQPYQVLVAPGFREPGPPAPPGGAAHHHDGESIFSARSRVLRTGGSPAPRRAARGRAAEAPALPGRRPALPLPAVGRPCRPADRRERRPGRAVPGRDGAAGLLVAAARAAAAEGACRLPASGRDPDRHPRTGRRGRRLAGPCRCKNGRALPHRLRRRPPAPEVGAADAPGRIRGGGAEVAVSGPPALTRGAGGGIMR